MLPEPGDTVKHIKMPYLNGGSPLNVIHVDGENVECDFFDKDLTNVQEWFHSTDLEIINKVKGGFRNAGEGS